MPLEHQVKQSLHKPLTMTGNLIRDLQTDHRLGLTS